MYKTLSAVVIVLLFGASMPVNAGNHTDALPPGLQKKLEQGKPLPPGWQKKVDIGRGDRLHRELYDYGDVRDIGDGREEVRVEDRIYTVIKDTREIINLLDQ
ncbi:hypothetical protein EDB94_2090 [Marinobacter sp. 3-2]|jgi:hypothetical protein|uniref:hypothetical protein n=1 Tax=Marinobacter sp. 3-2 TaxID=2485141 RepID=UPI000D3C23D5|nr:hypothetical protein [Marinobacter sp. 3-2]ROQ44744.1 hypothetical protein EDB94_2090 [Marinobacter sp. 3-2]